MRTSPGALQRFGGDASRPLSHLSRRPEHGGTCVGGHPASPRSHAEGMRAAVARYHHHVVERRAKGLRRDLGQRGGVSLALGGHADVDEDLAARIDADRRSLVRPDPGALGVAGDAHAESSSRRPLTSLASPVSLIVDQLERALEGGREVAGIVGDRDAVLVREPRPVGHLVGADQVAPPEFGRIQAETAGPPVEKALHDEHRLRPARAPVGRVRSLVGDEASSLAPVVRDPVRSGKVDDRVEGKTVALGGIGAHVREEPVVHPDDDAVSREPQAGLVHLFPVLAGRQEVLPPRLHPLDGPSQVAGRRRDQDLLRVHRALGPECATHVGHGHADALGRDAQSGRDGVADQVRVLGR